MSSKIDETQGQVSRGISLTLAKVNSACLGSLSWLGKIAKSFFLYFFLFFSLLYRKEYRKVLYHKYHSHMIGMRE